VAYAIHESKEGRVHGRPHSRSRVRKLRQVDL